MKKELTETQKANVEKLNPANHEGGDLSGTLNSLVSCPFCGTCNPLTGEDTSGDIAELFNFWIECRNEECSAEITAPTEIQCVERWNKRAR